MSSLYDLYTDDIFPRFFLPFFYINYVLKANLLCRHQVQLGVNMPALTNHKDFHEESAGSAAVDLFEACDVVLYFGIIDILQEYNMTKRAEHAWKSLKCDPLSISSVEPNLYSRRFISFLEKVFPAQM